MLETTVIIREVVATGVWVEQGGQEEAGFSAVWSKINLAWVDLWRGARVQRSSVPGLQSWPLMTPFTGVENPGHSVSWEVTQRQK